MSLTLPIGEHMEKHNILVMASGNGSNFKAIIDKCKHAKVQQLLTDNSGSYVINRAWRERVYAIIMEQTKDQSREDYSERLAQAISNLDPYPELIVMAGFMKILSPIFFSNFHEKQVLNIHPSLLPDYKGLNTHQRVLDAKEEEHGITIHYVTPELDSGPILWQTRFYIQPNDTVETLEHKCHELEHQWYPWVIDQVVKKQM